MKIRMGENLAAPFLGKLLSSTEIHQVKHKLIALVIPGKTSLYTSHKFSQQTSCGLLRIRHSTCLTTSLLFASEFIFYLPQISSFVCLIAWPYAFHEAWIPSLELGLLS